MIKKFMVLVLLGLIIVGCSKNKKGIKQVVNKEFTYQDLLVSNVTKEDFVFCLDTIKTKEDFSGLSEEYCKGGSYKKSYLYLSSHKKYLEVFLLNKCNVRGCMRSILDFRVDKEKMWLVDSEFFGKMNQGIMNKIISDYYYLHEKQYNRKVCVVSLDTFETIDNCERDNLYVSLLKGYVSFVLKEKEEETSGGDIDSIMSKYPFVVLIDNLNAEILIED